MVNAPAHAGAAWRRRRAHRICNLRGGAVLFEIMLALALFGGAAAFTLAAVRSVFTTLELARREHEAVDLARSKLAELEAGLITLAELRGESASDTDSSAIEAAQAFDERSPASRWLLDVATHRSEFAGLTLVELTVLERGQGNSTSDDQNQATGVRYTIRQLVALREVDPQAYEQDELFEGLPDEAAESERDR